MNRVERNNAIVSRLLDKSPVAVVAKEFAISATTVRNALREHKLASTNGELAVFDPYRMFRGAMPTPYNPSALVSRQGLSIFDRMRIDDQIKAAMAFKKLAVLASGWEITSPQDRPPEWEPTEFLEHVFTKLDGSLDDALTEIMSAFDYGFSIAEKVFAPIEGGEHKGKIGLKAIKAKKPHSFDFETDEFGNLLPDGLIQMTTEGQVRLPVDKFIILPHQFEFSNWYGRSDLESAYRPWWTKDNAYKWLAMLLERFGIPPVFALYNPDSFTPSQQTALATALERFQAATTGLIPRNEKDDLELWAPEKAGQAATVFIPSLDMMNRDIARALLMPGLLGLTADEATGSLARSGVHFDVFLLVTERLRGQIADTVVFEQIVKQLIDLNFPVDGEYPEFKFLPLTKEDRSALAEAWGKLVQTGAVTNQPQDEQHTRDVLGYPDFDETIEPEEPEPEPIPGGGGPPIPDEGIEPEQPGRGQGIGNRPFVFAEAREPNQWEKRVDFAGLERQLDEIERRGIERIQPAIENMRNTFFRRVSKDFNNELSFVESLKGFRGITSVGNQIGRFLEDAFRGGRASVRKELPDKATLKRELADDPNLIPKEAIKSLRTKKFWVTGLISDQLLGQARGVLMRSISTGATQRETQDELRRIFEPYVGDPNVIRDGVVVSPARLETIVRTNTTDVYNQGRLVEARRIGEFLTGFEYSAVIDSRTTEVCTHLDGKIFRPGAGDVDALKPPRHFNCRSLLVPITVAGPDVDEGDFINKANVGKGLDLSGVGFGGKGGES